MKLTLTKSVIGGLVVGLIVVEVDAGKVHRMGESKQPQTQAKPAVDTKAQDEKLKAAREDAVKARVFIDKLSVRDVGVFRHPATVAQILGKTEMLADVPVEGVDYYKQWGVCRNYPVYIEGVSTKDLIDGQKITLIGTFCVDGSKTYTTAAGVPKTILLLKPVEGGAK